MNVPGVNRHALARSRADSWLGGRSGGIRRAERNPSDWQLCPLVCASLSPKLLYFTEIMIFYGHGLEDNCCIPRVSMQGDTDELRSGKKLPLVPKK